MKINFRITIGDLVSIVGWLNNKPVISVLRRKKAIRLPVISINEYELIESMRRLGLNKEYIFFFDTLSLKIGVFIESNSFELDKERETLGKKIHESLKNISLKKNF